MPIAAEVVAKDWFLKPAFRGEPLVTLFDPRKGFEALELWDLARTCACLGAGDCDTRRDLPVKPLALGGPFAAVFPPEDPPFILEREGVPDSGDDATGRPDALLLTDCFWAPRVCLFSDGGSAGIAFVLEDFRRPS